MLDAGLRARAGRRAGRALHRRAVPGARLPGPAGADRRALRAPPVGGGPGARLYRTGDLARCRAGRRAGVPRPASTSRSRSAASASSRGRSRRRWRSIPAVREAAVAGRGRGPSGAWSPSWCRAGEGSAPDGAAAAPARPRLPAYMVPAALVLLRRAAAHPQRQGRPPGPARAGGAGGGDRRASSAPRAPGRGAARRIWAAVLGRERVGRRRQTSSTSAATRCWRRSWSPGCARRSASSCRCAWCSRRRPWRRSRRTSSGFCTPGRAA